MKILVTGPRGFVGYHIMQHFPDAIGTPSLQNITESQVAHMLEEIRPDVIIHTAAISDMRECEMDPEGSYQANVILPLWLAKHNPGAKLVAFSSDQVYNGFRTGGPFTEDHICPSNVYSREKAEMEQRLSAMDPNAVFLRAEWMYYYPVNRSNYIMNTLRAEGPIAASRKEFRGVTYIREVAENMDAVIRLPGGAYNFGSETDKCMFDITTEFLALAGRTNPVVDCEGGPNLWMDCSKARQLGVDFSTVSKGLEKCLRDSKLI